jgi:hypothetical protein
MNRRIIPILLLLAALCIGGWRISQPRETVNHEAVSANNPTRQSSGRPPQSNENQAYEAERLEHAKRRLKGILTSLRTEGKMPASEWSGEGWEVGPEILVGLLKVLKSSEFDGAWGTLSASDAQEMRLRVQRTSIWKLAEIEPFQALELALQSGAKDPHVKHELLCRVVSHIALTDPQQAVALMEGIPLGQSRTNALTGIAFYWSQQDLNATLAWIDNQTEAERDIVLRSIAPTWAATDGPAAIEFVARTPMDSIFYDTVQGWASKDPEAALAWLLASNDPDHRKAISSVYLPWAIADPDAAMQSALQLAPEFREGAIFTVSRYRKYHSPKRE